MNGVPDEPTSGLDALTAHVRNSGTWQVSDAYTYTSQNVMLALKAIAATGRTVIGMYDVV